MGTVGFLAVLAILIVSIFLFFRRSDAASRSAEAIVREAQPALPPIPFGHKPRLTGNDTVAKPRRKELSGLQAEGATIFIRYVDAKGDESERRISVRRIYTADDPTDFYIQAYCFEREAPRAFYASRMEEVIDLETGEVFENPIEFFKRELSPVIESTEQPDQAQTIKNHFQAVRLLKSELAALMFMSRADGRMHPKERQEILAYAIQRAPILSTQKEWLDRYLKRLYPSGDVFLDIVPELKRQSEANKVALSDTLRRIVDADGKAQESELNLLKKFQEALDIRSSAQL